LSEDISRLVSVHPVTEVFRAGYSNLQLKGGMVSAAENHKLKTLQ
jgi:hypothetical protein